jgi:hypothetical protein
MPTRPLAAGDWCGRRISEPSSPTGKLFGDVFD